MGEGRGCKSTKAVRSGHQRKAGSRSKQAAEGTTSRSWQATALCLFLDCPPFLPALLHNPPCPTGIPQIEAMLHQAKLLMEDPAPAKDIRPRLKKIEKVLVAAEEMATKFVQVAVPR